MAGVSTKEIKNRIRSMESTKQITKAMEMVAASKLRRAQAQVLGTRPYFNSLSTAIHDIICSNRDFSSPYLKNRDGGKALYVVVAGDRGLAGGYNSNILKLVMNEIQGKDASVLPIGKKAVEYFKSHGVPSITETYAVAADVSIGDCFSIANMLCKGFLGSEFDEIHVAYTDFVSILSQIPGTMKLLPLVRPEGEETAPSHLIEYEPSAEEVFAEIVPEYLAGILYGAICESRASEQAARRSAMDSATSNAEEMIADLSLKFNRARQAAITQEITEIVAGS